MQVEIISVGHELVKGAILDTNSKYLAEECEKAGLEVTYHTCIGDNLNIFCKLLEEASLRSQVILISGGLGPTPDDLAREAAAKFMRVDLTLYEKILEQLQLKFRKMGKSMPDANKKQAYFPNGAIILDNSIGTASGFHIIVRKSLMFFMPGVPREMKLMFKEQILPKIYTLCECKPKQLAIYKTFGISEAVIGRKLQSIQSDFPQVQMGTRFNAPTVELRLYAQEEYNSPLFSLAKSTVETAFNDWIYSKDGKEMFATMMAAFDNQSKLAIFEVDKGGVIPLFFSFEDDKKVLRGYELIPALPDDNIVQCIQDLAEKARKKFSATYGIAIFGIYNEEQAKFYNQTVGQVHIAFSTIQGCDYFSCNLPYGTDEYKRIAFATLVFDLVRRRINRIPYLKEILGKQLIVNINNKEVTDERYRRI